MCAPSGSPTLCRVFRFPVTPQEHLEAFTWRNRDADAENLSFAQSIRNCSWPVVRDALAALATCRRVLCANPVCSLIRNQYVSP